MFSYCKLSPNGGDRNNKHLAKVSTGAVGFPCSFWPAKSTS